MIYGYGISGSTHDFFCYDPTGKVHDGSSFVTWNDANYASYRKTATEQGTSGRFTGTEPAGTVAWGLRLRGASLAASPVVDDGAFPTLAASQTFSTTGNVGSVTGLTLFPPVAPSDIDEGFFNVNGALLNGASGTPSVGQTVIVASGAQAGEVRRITVVLNFGGGEFRCNIDRLWDPAGVTTIQLLSLISAGPWLAEATEVGKLLSIAQATGG